MYDIVGSDVRSFTADLCRKWLHSGTTRTDLFDSHIEMIYHWLKAAEDVHAAVLQADGVGDALKEVESIIKPIREAVSMIEDALCAALVGKDEMKRAQRQKELLYQKS